MILGTIRLGGLPVGCTAASIAKARLQLVLRTDRARTRYGANAWILCGYRPKLLRQWFSADVRRYPPKHVMTSMAAYRPFNVEDPLFCAAYFGALYWTGRNTYWPLVIAAGDAP